MDSADASIGEDHGGDSHFVRWARAPGGHIYRVEGMVPGPWTGPMFAPNPDDGSLSRFFLRRMNKFFDGAMRGPTPTRCYIEVWDVDAEHGEQLVHEESTSGIDEARRRGSELISEIKSGRPPHDP